MAKQEANTNYQTVLETVLMEMSAKNPEMATNHIDGRLKVINEEAILLRRILRKITTKKDDVVKEDNNGDETRGQSETC